jgi:hypothetical protein
MIDGINAYLVDPVLVRIEDHIVLARFRIGPYLLADTSTTSPSSFVAFPLWTGRRDECIVPAIAVLLSLCILTF